MTLKEAKKILESEGFVVERFLGVLIEDVKAASWEKIEVGEAMKVVAENGYFPFMEKSKYEERKARLKKEYEKNTKAPGPGEEQSKEGNPALAESASQFNDALLDEQAKKIAELTKDKELMKKATLSQLDDFIEIYNLLTKESQKTKRLGKEIAKLNGIIHDKNAILSDVAEELRLSKIREKNLNEVCQKYVKEVEDLREQLANKVVDKIDAQALKSAESALAWKEKVIAKKDMALAYYEKKIAENDDVIADLGKELTESKKRVEWVRNASKEYCDYGVAANEFIKKLSRLYILASNNGNIDVEMLERCKNYQTYGFPANCNRETKKEINDIARGNENKILSLFRDDSVGSVTNQKDCSPVKDTHPTEDNPEEVKMNEILEHVRKVLEEGGTVSTSYDKAEEGGDQSATIVQHRKSIVDLFKEIKRLW